MKNQKGFVAPLLLAIIVVLVIGGGIYISSIKKSEAPVLPDVQTTGKVQQQTNTQTPPANNQIIVNPTANWKIYTNVQYGFSLSYPTNTNVSLVTHVAPHGTDLILPNSNFIEKDGVIGSILNFMIFQKSTNNLGQYVSSDVNKIQETNNKFLDANGNPAGKVTYTQITINGNMAYLVRYEYPQSPDQKPVNRLYIQNLTHTFIFQYSDDNASVANQILSTFKFTK